MAKFDFYSVGRIVFGRGQFARVGELATELGAGRLMILTNASDSLNDALLSKLAASHIHAISIRQRSEPIVDQIDQAAETARRHHCNGVIGIGGGSAIDAAKAVAGLLTNGGSARDYMEVVGKGLKITKPAAPWIAIPCTAGTGAEVTRNAVIGDPINKFKASLRSEHLLAKIALVDPELTVGVRPQITARTGMDALCQCIEAYTSIAAQPMTDVLALEGIVRAARSLKKAFNDGQDLDAREDLAMAALLSGIALTNAGLGAVHGFAAPLGACYPIPHGTACAALLPGVMAANVEALRQIDPQHPSLARYAAVGKALLADHALSQNAAIAGGVEFVERLRIDLKIDALACFGLSPDGIPAVVELAQKASSMRFNPVKLSTARLEDILRQAVGRAE